MLTAVKNQIKISFLSVKYALMREMLNKVTFFTNITFMILNNAAFIIQWIVLFALKDKGYNLKIEVDTTKRSVADELKLLNPDNIIDINISNMPLEEIISDIYKKKDE